MLDDIPLLSSLRRLGPEEEGRSQLILQADRDSIDLDH